MGVTGTLSTSSGTAAKNATITFTPSQVFFVGGTSVVVAPSQCATDINGSVVGIGNPLAPRVSAQYTGALPPGNYYVKFTWYDQFGAQTLPSVEVAQQLTATGELQILPPVGAGPPAAVGMDVYIGAAPGTETYQGQTTSLTAQYTQNAALATTGASPPIQNLTTCRVIANDAGWPTGTGYQVSLVDASGNTLFEYPELWQFIGPGSAYNLSNGIPYYHGQVTYPIPVLTVPYNHNMQSISGPLSLTDYNLVNVAALGVDTQTPAWGIDVEGAGLLADINAAGGYLVNGQGGAAGLTQCLASVSGAPAASFVNCYTGALYYQQISSEGLTTLYPQRNDLDFLTPLSVQDSVSGSTHFTLISLAEIGTGNSALVANALAGTGADPVMAAGLGAAGDCMEWGAAGATDSGGPCTFTTPTQTDQTASRAFGTQYQNTTALRMQVSGWGTVHSGSGDSEIACLDGPSSASLTLWSNTTSVTVSGEPVGFACLIPPGDYYEVTVTNLINPLSTAGKWYETTY